MSQNVSINLEPPLFEERGLESFQNSGQALFLAASPRDDSVAIWPAPITDPRNLKPGYTKVQPLYTATILRPPTSERRVFFIDTAVIFVFFQNRPAAPPASEVELSASEHKQQVIRKLMVDYCNFSRECWTHTSHSIEKLHFGPDHYRKLYTCVSLFTVLYVPEIGFEDAPIGDELMEWLNTNYIEPSTEEGDHLSSLQRPWEDENFWSYVARATLRGLSKASAFFLDALAEHPSENLRRISQHLTPLLKNHPRLYQFSTERDFAISSRRWKEKVKTLRLELDRVPEDDRSDGFDDWWDRFSDIVSILEGRAEVLKRLCLDLGASWKEVCVAWGIFVDPRLRRQDLPEVVVQVLDEMPPDPTDFEDVIHSLMMLGKPTQVLSQAFQLDPWLSAHLADVMESLELIDQDPDDSGLNLRQQYVLSYADHLRSDPTLWRHAVDYMCSCGDIGKEMADQVLMRVPLHLQLSAKEGTPADEASQIRSGDIVGVLKQVNESCAYYQREGARRVVCKIAARTFLAEKEYGLAVAYTSSAEDWQGLGRIVNCVLDAYFEEGPANFARLVSGIEPTLERLRQQPSTVANGVFIYRLLFAVHFADFHKQRSSGHLHEAAREAVAMLREEIAPKSWWAVVLSDSVDLLLHGEELLFTPADVSVLLHKLQEITTRTSHGAGADYLSVLARGTKGKDEKSALQRLQVVRLALAKYYARCGAIGVSGRPGGVFEY